MFTFEYFSVKLCMKKIISKFLFDLMKKFELTEINPTYQF